jgi:hypothetical protein
MGEVWEGACSGLWRIKRRALTAKRRGQIDEE